MTSLDEQKRTNYVLSFARKNAKLTSNGNNSLRLCESNNYFVFTINVAETRIF